LEFLLKSTGLTFKKEEANAWHPDVELFSVYDAKSEDFVGQFYLDMHPREGKYSHAAV
jgi:Zn-dependent oligopeptidase